MKKLVLMSIFLSVPMVVLSDNDEIRRRTIVCDCSALVLGDNFSQCMADPLTLEKARLAATAMNRAFADDPQSVKNRFEDESLRESSRYEDPFLSDLMNNVIKKTYVGVDSLDDAKRRVDECMREIIQELEERK